MPAPPEGIVRVIGIANDLARIDIDGDGGAESASKLEAVGITSCDLMELTKVYRPGTKLHVA
jgi:hypothetical protein